MRREKEDQKFVHGDTERGVRVLEQKKWTRGGFGKRKVGARRNGVGDDRKGKQHSGRKSSLL